MKYLINILNYMNQKFVTNNTVKLAVCDSALSSLNNYSQEIFAYSEIQSTKIRPVNQFQNRTPSHS